MPRFFRTNQTGPAIFMITDYLSVTRIGPYEGAIAAATTMWPAEGILLVDVTEDVAAWLRAVV